MKKILKGDKMNEKEYEIICNYIFNMSREIYRTFNRDKKLLMVEELLEWLKHNGGYVLIKEDEKRLKTKDKVISTYMTKWGIKFKVIKDFKYYKINYVEIKLLTKYYPNKRSD